MNGVSDEAISKLCAEYEEQYNVVDELRKGGERHEVAALQRPAANWACAPFWKTATSSASPTTFEDLHGLTQLPGLAVQRLMADGYGFAGEGDWKTAALVARDESHGSADMPGGTSFMEDYTYHLNPDGQLVLGSHMLEICPSIAADKPAIEIHPLGIGGKDDPARLVFDAHHGRCHQRRHDGLG